MEESNLKDEDEESDDEDDDPGGNLLSKQSKKFNATDIKYNFLQTFFLQLFF